MDLSHALWFWAMITTKEAIGHETIDYTKVPSALVKRQNGLLHARLVMMVVPMLAHRIRATKMNSVPYYCMVK